MPKGNPNGGQGRRKGIPNKVNAVTRDRIQAEADPVGLMIAIAKGEPVAAAVSKDMADLAVMQVPTLDQRLQAIRWLGDRVIPPVKSLPLVLDLPDMRTAEDVVVVTAAILHAATDGTLTVEDAKDLASIVEARRKAIETEELERRIVAIEEVRANA